ncbi:hypothetical protein [Geopseudomonas sagittaria]|uniref:hypothetical protein n=1 Tax=Geopseudomonas sagittaria TaxID=1135990 RepID=UPI0011145904|nr:hypothetical protein [Pseudomonas sagittaria]
MTRQSLFTISRAKVRQGLGGPANRLRKRSLLVANEHSETDWLAPLALRASLRLLLRFAAFQRSMADAQQIVSDQKKVTNIS